VKQAGLRTRLPRDNIVSELLSVVREISFTPIKKDVLSMLGDAIPVRFVVGCGCSSGPPGGAAPVGGAGRGAVRWLFVPRAPRCAVHFSTTSRAEAAGC